MTSPTPPAAISGSTAAVRKQSKRVGVLAIVFGALFAGLGVILVVFGAMDRAFLYAGLAVIVLAGLMLFLGSITLSIASRYPDIEAVRGRNDGTYLLVLLVAVAGFLLVLFVGGTFPDSLGIAVLVLFMTVPSLQFYSFNRKMLKFAGATPPAE
jgi:drug/metabolite transporter (DMT)-like permease